ncbi:MAG: hypothetical protein ACYDC3_13505 [Candidatus Binataceae bacterium]
MESSPPKPAADFEPQIKREGRARPASLRRFVVHLPWFSRRGMPMQIPLRSVAREYEELFHPYD